MQLQTKLIEQDLLLACLFACGDMDMIAFSCLR